MSRRPPPAQLAAETTKKPLKLKSKSAVRPPTAPSPTRANAADSPDYAVAAGSTVAVASAALAPAAAPAPARSPIATVTTRDKRSQRRIELCFNNAFAVIISNPLLGESNCIARNISAGGMFVECNDPFPLGSVVRIRFRLPSSLAGYDDDLGTARRNERIAPERVPPIEIIARAEVKNHYFINYADHGLGPRSVAGMGVRFLSFEDDGAERLKSSLGKVQLH